MVNLWNDFAFIHMEIKHLIHNVQKKENLGFVTGYCNACTFNVGDINCYF